MNRVSAVIVVYFPDMEQLYKLIGLLSAQVQSIVVVDNSENSSKLSFTDSKTELHYIKLDENQGIAKAQNIGIVKAKELGTIDVILFDQDSTPSLSLVKDLLTAREVAKNDGIHVAAIGPSHIDTDSNEPSSFVTTDNKKVALFQPDLSKQYMACDFIIASGCLMEMIVLDKIGLMEEALFIDCVDIEWGFRAKSFGLTSLFAPRAQMHHKIGGSPLMFLGRAITTHAPLRHYYFYRNFYLLLARNYVPLVWKKHVFLKSILQACVFCLLLRPRLQHLKAIVKGIYHGVKGITGKYAE